MKTSAMGCKLPIQKARTSSSSEKIVSSFYFATLYKTLFFSNLGLMSLHRFVPSALISSVINCSNMVSVCVPAVHKRHRNSEFDWQKGDYEERISMQWSCSLHITYKWRCHNCLTLQEQIKRQQHWLYPWRNVKWKILCVVIQNVKIIVLLPLVNYRTYEII